jgi:tetratricopeptide (TPR) repeat protein
VTCATARRERGRNEWTCDFAYNRSFGLKALHQYEDVDYALVIDADDVIIGYEPNFDAAAFKATLTADLYHVEMRLRNVVYKRPQICNSRLEFLYRGVLHEIIDTPDGGNSWGTGKINYGMAHGFYMVAGLEGSRSIDPKKYHQSESNKFLHSRYAFYLAQSLRDTGERRRALKADEQRVEMGFWHEERFISLYNAAELKAELGYSATEVIATYLEALEICPNRLETLHGAVRFCRGKRLFHQGYVIAKGAIGLRRECPQDGLFVQRWIYDYGMLDELAVAAYWAGFYQESLDACEEILIAGKIPAEERGRVEANALAARQKLAA